MSCRNRFFSSVGKLICRTTKIRILTSLRGVSAYKIGDACVQKNTKRETFCFSWRDDQTEVFSPAASHSLYTQTSRPLLFTDEELGLECDGSGGEGVR